MAGKPLVYDGQQLDLRVNSYANSELLLALQSVDEDGFPYATLTVNLGTHFPDGSIMPKDCAFVDENNSPGIGRALEESGFATPYLRGGKPVWAASGYCMYPLYEFKPDRLREADLSGYVAYSEGYDRTAKYLRRMTVAGFEDLFAGAAKDDDTPDFE